jgi:hydroxyethylthiazole kinase-like uncharacterized protein yjeF
MDRSAGIARFPGGLAKPRAAAAAAQAFPPEVLTPAEMARLDAQCGVPGQVLMEHAGRAVVRAIRARFRPCRAVVLCGPGNNGGDGYVVARLLDRLGWPVRVLALAPPATENARAAAARWRGPVQPLAPEGVGHAALVVDALFGAGLSRPIDLPLSDVIRAIRAPVVAIDLPSGISGLTGAMLGAAPPAALTVTFCRLKPGHLLLPGRGWCGEIVCADIGIPDAVVEAIRPAIRLNGPKMFPRLGRGAGAHKWSHGGVVVVAGAGMPGAARLAAAAARRSGAGHVTVAAPDAATATLLRADPGLVVHDGPLAPLLDDARRTAWVVGPGGGAGAADALRAAIAAGRRVVADADALRDAGSLAGAALVTPHDGEFTRLFGPPGEDRIAAVRAAAAELGTVVLLKGPTTIVAAPDGEAAVAANAPPWLATAGTGDVLAGVAAAWLGNGSTPFQAACAAAWATGEAAARLGPGLLAEDLPLALPLLDPGTAIPLLSAP